jgi:hypothetical protein
MHKPLHRFKGHIVAQFLDNRMVTDEEMVVLGVHVAGGEVP